VAVVRAGGDSPPFYFLHHSSGMGNGDCYYHTYINYKSAHTIS
jgi:hypothetical protein